MHPLVRDLYKRVILVGPDYPFGVDNVRSKTWKKALRNPDNCPSCYCTTTGKSAVSNDNHNRNEDSLPLNNASNTRSASPQQGCERDLRKAVGKGRYYVREMIGVIQLKKYRTMKKRYSNNDNQNDELQRRMQEIVQEAMGGAEEGET